jgi:hypothetical protein
VHTKIFNHLIHRHETAVVREMAAMKRNNRRKLIGSLLTSFAKPEIFPTVGSPVPAASDSPVRDIVSLEKMGVC